MALVLRRDQPTPSLSPCCDSFFHSFTRLASSSSQSLTLQTHSTFHLWSAGNVRVDGRDLTIPPAEAHDLIRVIHSDERFEVVQVTSLDGEDGEDKRVRRRVLLPSLQHCNHPIPIARSRIMAASLTPVRRAPNIFRLTAHHPAAVGCRVDCRSWEGSTNVPRIVASSELDRWSWCL